MRDARVLVVGRDADCAVDSGRRTLDVVKVRRPRAALERLDEGFDYVVCHDCTPEEVAGFETAATCPVLEGLPETERTLAERVDALVGALETDGGVSLGPHAELSAAVKRRAIDAAPVGVTIADARLEDYPLVYVNDGFETMTGYTASEVLGRNCRFLQGEGTDPLSVTRFREALDRAEPRVVELRNYRKDGSPFWNRVELAPVEDEAGAVTHFVGFQMDVTARREAEAEVERERADLEALLDRVNGLLGDVTAGLMEASSRRAVERALTERLAGSGAYRGAWVATPDLGSGRLEPGASVGVEDPPTVSLDGDTLVARAHGTGELVFGTGRTADGDEEPVAAVPLQYRGTTYGVCCVHGGAGTTFGQHDRAVFRVLGRAAATAIHAIEGRRLLGSDAVTELELRLPESFPAALAARLEATLTYEGAVFGDDHVRTFYTVAGADAATVTAEAARESAVEGCRAVTGDPDPLLEFVVGTESLVSAIADRGAELRTAAADADGVTLTLSLPVGAETRSVVESLRGRFGPVELLATRERDRPTRTRPEFREELESRLTDRQLTALRLAHVGGYFAPTRRASGDELAAAMGVSRSTFHQHLRAAQRKLVDGFFDPESDT
ncbi:PAS domain-containing protein [Salinirubellus salinus]|uniref:PAS domain-containing protein n=1 Tax=Salinirubellus salinus TaxID=1364945 RepID=A0A9E7R601_9EURY|nr:bacterio-opsin activator domain-containing protein [Salinirubellus salinus]UWM56459.1 PAS domain-containing protein [Salinirubellus salinus]